jgi:hypothetical protein
MTELPCVEMPVTATPYVLPVAFEPGIDDVPHPTMRPAQSRVINWISPTNQLRLREIARQISGAANVPARPRNDGDFEG